MKFNSFIFISVFILALSLTSALQVYQEKLPITNGTTLNVNNSQYLQGYTPLTLRTFFQSTYDTIYCKLTGCTMTGDLTTSGNINATTYYGDGSQLTGISGGTTYNITDGTADGQMSFWNTTSWTNTETSEMFWDDTNKRLGYGTINPLYKVDVRGGASTDAISSRIGYNFNPVTPAVQIGGYTLSAGTDLEIGLYYYITAYVTASGTTGFVSGTPLAVTTTSGNQVVNLTGLPISSDPDVIARKIYRTKVGATNDAQYYLATINDNTATTYQDTTPDASLTGSKNQFYKVDTTTKYITTAGIQSMILDTNLVAVGGNAGGTLLAGGGQPATRTALFGYNAGRYITTGAGNNIFGQAGYSLTTGNYNLIMGDLAGRSSISTYADTFLGASCGSYITSGYHSVFLGREAGNLLTGGGTLTRAEFGTYIGYNAKGGSSTEANAIVIGKNAEGLGSNTIVIGNSDHTITQLFGNVGIGTPIPTQKLDVHGSINQTNGNATINNIYGGMYYHNHTATELNFASDGVYYQLFIPSSVNLNGFTHENSMTTGANLTAEYSGIYQATYMSSGDGQNNHEYFTSVFINEVNQDNCENHHKMASGGDIITQSGNCFINLDVGDKVSLRVADIGGTGTGNYYSSNLNLLRIGS